MMEFLELPLLTSSYGWNALFGLTERASVYLVLPLSFLFFFILILHPLYFLLSFTERKLAADLQARVGPNRTAMTGLFQVVADTIKLGLKTEGPPVSRLKNLNPKLKNMSLYAIFAFLPLGTSFIFLDTEVDALLPLVCFGVVFIISLFSNDDATDLKDEIASHQQSFHWLSAWIPATIAMFVVIVKVGSARWTTILDSQSHGLFSWTVFSSPFGFLSFFIFIFSGLVMFQQPPFHTVDRNTRSRAGTVLALFNLDQFYSVFVWCILGSALFLGGQSVREISDTTFIWAVYQLFGALVKASTIYILVRVVARALPQLKQDQMTDFCWQILTPAALVCLIGELVWVRIFSGVFNQ